MLRRFLWAIISLLLAHSAMGEVTVYLEVNSKSGIAYGAWAPRSGESYIVFGDAMSDDGASCEVLKNGGYFASGDFTSTVDYGNQTVHYEVYGRDNWTTAWVEQYVRIFTTTPTISWSARSYPSNPTLSGADLNASAANPYPGSRCDVEPTGSFSYSVVSASGAGASPTSGGIGVGTVLHPGTYTIRASYSGDINYNAVSADTTFTVADANPPSVPRWLYASDNTTGSSFTLHWNASSDDVGVAGYEVLCNGGSRGGTTATSMNIGGLQQVTTYTLYVRAYDTAGNWSGWSGPLSVVTPDVEAPSVPGGLFASNNNTGTSFTLNWGASSDNVGVTGYEVLRDGSYYGTTGSTSMVIAGLSDWTPYSMQVRAGDAANKWSSLSAPLEVRTPDVTAPLVPDPAKFKTTTVSVTYFNLSWEAPFDKVGATSYRVAINGSLKETSSTTSLRISGLERATTYSVTIQAGDAAGNWSTWSQPASFTTGTVAVPVWGNPFVTDTTGHSFTLYWQVGTAMPPPGVTIPQVVAFEVYVGGNSVGTTSATSLAVSSLTDAHTYPVKVRAQDSDGNWSDFSEERSVTTPDVTAPDAPSGLNAPSTTHSTVTLGWNTPNDNVGVTGYKLYRTVSGSTSEINLGPAASYSDSGLSPLTSYSYTVKAFDAAGNLSGNSNICTVTTLRDPNADDDDDGMSNGWEEANGFNPDNASDALGDADSDGLTNVAEYNLGTLPRDASSPGSKSAELPASYSTLASGNQTKTEVVGITSGQLSVDKSGAATYSLPIWVSPGTAGMEPKLSLNYSSQAGNGIAGFGWSLSGLSTITRGPQSRAVDGRVHGVDFSWDDRYYLDGQRLIAISGVDGGIGTEYRTETESFSRVVSYGLAGKGPQWFKVWTKAGLIIEFGHDTDGKSRRAVSGRTEMISWSVNKISDTAGNYMTFTYDQDAIVGTMTLSRIDYTGHDGASVLGTYASVRFAYENRADKTSGYSSGARIAQNVRLKYIRAYYGETVVKTYTLSYAERLHNERSILTSFEEAGKDGRSYPALTFDYSNPLDGWDQPADFTWGPPANLGVHNIYGDLPQGTGFVDLNGDGLPDMVRSVEGEPGHAWLNIPSSGWVLADGGNSYPDYRIPLFLQASTLYNTDRGDARFADLNGDGLVDIANPNFAYLNTSAGFVASARWTLPYRPPFYYTPTPSYPNYNWYSQPTYEGWDFKRGAPIFIDLNGDGLLDCLCFDSVSKEFYYGGDPNNGSNTETIYFPEAWINRGPGSSNSQGAGWENKQGYEFDPYYSSPYLGKKFIDLNGDGLPDWITEVGRYNRYILLNTGSGWRQLSGEEHSRFLTPEWLLDGEYARQDQPVGTEVVDLNGDGVPDLVSRNDATGLNSAHISTGNGWIVAPSSFQAPVQLWAGSNPDGSAFLDVNNDGLADLVHAWETDCRTWLGTSAGWTGQPVSDYALRHELVRSERYYLGNDFIDLNGDGAVDQVWNFREGPNVERGVAFNRRVNPDRLTKVTTGLGVKAELVYKPLTDPSVYTKGTDFVGVADADKVANLIGPMYVVSEVKNDDGAGSQYAIGYAYGALRSHRDRGSLGFGWMTTSDKRTGIKSTTTFRQNFPYIGMPSATVTKTATNKVLSESLVEYSEGTLNWSGTHFAYASHVYEKSNDLNGAFLSSTSTTTTYDAYGNALTIETETLNGDESHSPDGYSKSTTNTYDNIIDTASESGATRWHLGRLSSATVTSSAPAQEGTGIPTSMTRTSDFEYDEVNSSSTGFLTKEIVEPDPALPSDPDNLTLTTTYVYDAFGHKTTATTTGGGLTGRTTSTAYDSQGRFPLSTTNALDQTETYAYDPYFGVVTSLTGPNNLATTWAYDGMGRKILETRPASNPQVSNCTAINYRWCGITAPTGAVYQIETVTSGATPSLALYDAFGRALYGFGINGGTNGTPCVVGSRTWYDSYGRAYRTSLPFYYTGSTPSPGLASETGYDALNRPLWIKTADDNLVDTDPADGFTGGPAVSTIAYDGRTTTTTNPKGQEAKSIKNSQGQVVETFTNEKGSGANRGHVAFKYDPLGQLCKTTVYNNDDASSVSTSLSYDQRGRKTGMVDPDMGTWSYAYNAAGELTSQTDAKGQTVTMTYDALGRLATRAEPKDTTTTDTTTKITTTWTYGTTAPAVGKLLSVSATEDREKSYVENYTYDALGRPSVLTRTIDDADYRQAQTYDDYSRPLVTTYPGFYKVKNVYNALGFLTEVRDARSATSTFGNDIPANYLYWQANGYSLTGAISNSTLGNGTTLDRLVSDVTGRTHAITSINAYASGIQNDLYIQDIHYVYDSIGNVTSREDTSTSPTTRVETFTYDGLNRLTRSTSTGGPTPSSTIDVAYNALGNILSKTNAGTYTYRTDGVRPHAVDSLLAPNSSTPRSFTYDANGNLAYDGQRSITWTSYNQVKKIVTQSGRTTEFWFGAGHERVVQQDTGPGGAKTVYVGSLMEVVTTGSLIERKHYIYTPAGRVAVRTERNDSSIETRFLHQDAIGSVVAVTDELGSVEQRFVYDAWGLRTQTANTHGISGGVVTRGYTDHEHLDGFGLIHMNGRVYDPVLGRFLSADPFVQSPGDSQSYNRYSYCSNEPVNHTDPSGYFKLSLKQIVIIAAIVVLSVVTAGAALAAAGAVGTWGTGISMVATASFGAASGMSALSAAMIAGAAGGFASGFAGSLLNGGSLGDAFKAGVIGGIVGGVSAGIASKIGDFAQTHEWFQGAGQHMSHGIAQGAITEATGGEFRHGFYAAAFASAAAGPISRNVDGVMAQTAAAAAVGGTASSLGGGKFANGAVSGAFTYLFNQAAHKVTDHHFTAKQFSKSIADRVSEGGKDIASKDGFGSAALYYSDNSFSAFDADSLVNRITQSNENSVALFLHGGRGVIAVGDDLVTDNHWSQMKGHVKDLYVFGCEVAGNEAAVQNIANLTGATVHASPYPVGYYKNGQISSEYEAGKFTKPGHVLMIDVAPK